MKISKLINNNIVSSVDENGREIIIMGRGIGFKAREGMDIPDERIEKVFRLEGEDVLGGLKICLPGCRWSILRYPMRSSITARKS